MAGLVVALLLWAVAAPGQAARAHAEGVSRITPVLVYHRFADAVNDASTVRVETFRQQLEYLKQHRIQVIPLNTLIGYLRGEGPPPPPRAVVITADDGHVSVFTRMLPLVREYGVPVTLFVYPSAISNASYAMTWQQLQALRDTGLFDVQSHTYWHPNFAREKRRLSASEYRAFASIQLCKARTVLEARLGIGIDVVSWPFGLYDEGLFDVARACGYVAGVTLERRPVTAHDALMVLPRFMVVDADVGRRFAAMLPPETAP